MFELRHGESRHQVVLATATTFIGLLKHRKVNGDIVYKDGKVYKSTCYLWPWEKADPDCYAMKTIKEAS